ncbi:MAG: hypothetical protein F4Y45_11595 [Acidobacteria bacterium]|nr:hypothetical protein [Acidobacteriota bacterium]MYJ02851.1 hypothetical protein [Acidobacteriota bacterium]
MAEFCSYLDNTSPFEEEGAIRDVRTQVIGDWLRLAGQLETVEINTWKYAGDDALYCDPIAERYDSDAKHFTTYATSLTRYIFVCNALEEAYRFVAHHYDQLAQQKGIAKGSLVYTPAMKAAYLVDQISESELPANFQHIAANLVVAFEDYQRTSSPRLSGLDSVSKSDASYALHLARNLRNHIAHGIFPLVDNFDYSSGPPLVMFQNLLFHACRLATVCMQGLLGQYCKEFRSHDYKSIENAHGEEFDRFLDNCTIGYSAKLHLKGDFTLGNWI